MRQIFSVILAAALVFGGALFMAGYFSGIEVRDERASADASVSKDDRTVWHCPEVSELLKGSIPEGFSRGTPERDRPDERGEWPNDDFVWPDESYEWSFAVLRGRFIDGGVYQFAGDLACQYTETKPRKKRWRQSFALNLAPGMRVELHPDSAWEKGWGHMSIDIGCDEAIADCGFYVVETDG